MASLLKQTLETHGFDVTVASDSVTARSAARSTDPDIALIDVALGRGPSGVDLAHVLQLDHPGIALILLTRLPDLRAIGLEVKDLPPGTGFLRKDLVADTGELLAAIEAVVRESGMHLGLRQVSDDPLAGLTNKQFEVLRLVAAGYTNAAIARRRDLSERAVEESLQRIYRALGIDVTGERNPRVAAVLRYLAIEDSPRLQ